MSGLKKQLAKNSVWNFTAQGAISVLNFFLIPILVKGLGAEGFGLWVTLGLFSASGYAVLLELGLQSTVSKFTAQFWAEERHDKVQDLVGTASVLFACAGLIGCLGGFAVFPFWASIFKVSSTHASEFQQSLVVVFFSYLFVFPSFAVTGFLQGLHRFAFLRQLELSGHVARFVIFSGLVFLGYGLFPIIVAATLIQAVQFLTSWVVAARAGGFRMNFRRFSPVVLKEIRHMMTVTFLSRISGLAFRQADVLTVSIILGPTAVGAYEVATKAAYVLKSTIGRLNEIIVPAVSSAFHKEPHRRENIGRVFEKALRVQLFAGLPIAIGLWFFAPQFLRLWVGSAFSDVASTFRLALFVVWIQPLNGLSGAVLLGMGKRLNETTLLSIATSVLNLGLTIVLLKHVGISGAIIGTLTAWTIATALLLRYLSQEIPIHWMAIVRDMVLTPFVVACCWGGIAWILPTLGSTLWMFTLAFALFVGLILGMILFFIVDREERALLFNTFTRRLN